MDISAALPTFVITLREGVEAALVVGLVLACLAKAGQARLNRWVYGGVGAGLGASLGVGLLLGWGLAQIQGLAPRWQGLLEPGMKMLLCGLAIAMLSWMLIWMTRQARSLKGEIEGSVAALIAQTSPASQLQPNTETNAQVGTDTPAAGWGIFSLIFIAVLREGTETAVFILANLQQGLAASLGAIAGLLAATGVGFALFKFGLRINLARFFQVMGLLLLLIVAGLVTSLVKNLEATAIALQAFGPNLCWSEASCLMGPMLWDTSGLLPERQFPGLLLKALLGYRDHLYGLQAAAYGVFLLGVGGLYFRSLQGIVRSSRPKAGPEAGKALDAAALGAADRAGSS